MHPSHAESNALALSMMSDMNARIAAARQQASAPQPVEKAAPPPQGPDAEAIMQTMVAAARSTFMSEHPGKPGVGVIRLRDGRQYPMKRLGAPSMIEATAAGPAHRQMLMMTPDERYADSDGHPLATMLLPLSDVEGVFFIEATPANEHSVKTFPAAPEPTVKAAAPQPVVVHVEPILRMPKRVKRVTVDRDKQGNITGTEEREETQE